MIDAEWRSDYKWQRLLKHCDLKGKRVADIGCHNGYYMFRMANENPSLVVGFEPFYKHYLSFLFMQRFAQVPQLAYEPFGVEYISSYLNFFDVIFCLGILYHHTDPMKVLKDIRRSLTKGGILIVDCQGIAGDDSFCLVPSKRYAGAKGFWFLPTVTCLINWINRAGFSNIRVVYDQPLTSFEQRSSEWAPVASLKDGLNKWKEKTIEGYPLPRRFYIRAERG